MIGYAGSRSGIKRVAMQLDGMWYGVDTESMRTAIYRQPMFKIQNGLEEVRIDDAVASQLARRIDSFYSKETTREEADAIAAEALKVFDNYFTWRKK